MERKPSGRSTVVVSKDQLSCDMVGETAILNLKDGKYYALDKVGARIWMLIQQPRTVNEVSDAIVNEYDVELDRCENDPFALFQE